MEGNPGAQEQLGAVWVLALGGADTGSQQLTLISPPPAWSSLGFQGEGCVTLDAGIWDFSPRGVVSASSLSLGEC